MTLQEAIELVNNVTAWKGNAFTLATLIVLKCREDYAVLAESMASATPEEIAAAIRNT